MRERPSCYPTVTPRQRELSNQGEEVRLQNGKRPARMRANIKIATIISRHERQSDLRAGSWSLF